MLYLKHMYIKLHKLSWITKQKTQKFDPHKINKGTLQYKLLLITQWNPNIPYNCPAVNTGIISLHALTGIHH